MKDELLDEMDMYPYPDVKLQYFAAPQTSDSFDKVLQHVEQTMQGDSPLAFGFHPNAEIGFRTDQSEQLCLSILDLGAGDEASGEEGASKQTVAESALQDILENHRDAIFDIDAVLSLLDEPGPYHTVFLQECELMNALIETMLATLEELDLGFKGELTMGDHMERLQDALFLDRVPGAWSKVAYPSIRGLTTWLANLKGRLEQLREWTNGPTDIPVVTWLSGLFNPTSFLTAVMQTTAQAQSLELDKLRVATEVTKRIAVDGREEDHFPPLLVLVRDFALTPTRDGVAISDQEYLEEALRDRGTPGQKRHERRNETRQALRRLFPRGRRSCTTLVRPALDEASLRRAHALKDEELREEFVAKLKLLRSSLVDGRDEIGVTTIRGKSVLGAPCSASALAALARHHAVSYTHLTLPTKA